ncbi:unnamed protein product [Cuscuta epithymum]|uniref:F-box domain-containing protein n=1 Tax=Cuscuta epithymum TaxID=186058 RepID=A0AAV0G191_9ASTE|nr:unnamed protein product [Cuscuta epithymum]CAH9141192.1 unnamed protein product [Cuscuta epithymum]
MPNRYGRRQKFVWRPKKKDPAGAPSTAPPPPPPPWVELPRDLTANILQRLGVEDVLRNAIMVCTTWRNVCKDPTMWRVINMSKPSFSDDDELEDMCRHAVELSQGELNEIIIEDFCTNELLLYIAQRSSKLKKLRLVSCYCVSNDCLSKAAIQLPLLQDIQIYFCSLSVEFIKTAGRSCPLLKSFTYNKDGCRDELVCDEEAVAVAEHMKGLHHLSLFGSNMTNKGLRAIVDGCPHLKSLDMRRCFNVAPEADLLEKCSKQIKDLKYPYDSMSDYEFSDYVEAYDELQYSMGFSDEGYDFDDEYDEYFDYDDYTDPFSHEYFEHFDDLYPNVPPEWFM